MFNLRWLAFVLCVVCMLSGIKCWANDLTPTNEPSTQAKEVQNSGAVISVQKQPVTETTTQTVKAKKCFFCIFIQVNGKIEGLK